jgi:protein-disulfide isomerase
VTPVKRNAIVSAIVVALFVAFVATALALRPKTADPTDAATTGAGTGTGKLVRENSHRLGAAGTGKVVLVEFLDFECESCRAAYPVVEELRTTYAGKVDFVVRYFPIPSHTNAINSAVAVEAAARNRASSKRCTSGCTTPSPNGASSRTPRLRCSAASPRSWVWT